MSPAQTVCVVSCPRCVLPDLVRRLAQCVVVSWCGGCRRALTGWWWRPLSHAVDPVEMSLAKCVWYRVPAVFLSDRVPSPNTVCGRQLVGSRHRRAMAGWWW